MTPDAPIVAQTRSVRWCRALALGLGLALTVNTAFAQDGRASFDIPAQSLARALYDFSTTTGIEILVDARHAAGRQSPGVKGSMTPRDALKTLLAGSNLIAQDFSPGTVTLSVPTMSAVRVRPESDLPYFADIQRAVQQVMCSDARTLPGRYRLALKLWIGGSGEVLRSKRLDTTGDDGLDAVLDAAIQKIRIGRPPPPDLPQPVALVILPRPTSGSGECPSGAPDLRRASNR